jgi:hypothetical protein
MFDSCLVQMDIGTWGTPHQCFKTVGGDVHIRSNVVDIIGADWLLVASGSSSLELRDNTFHGYHNSIEIYPGQQGPITITNNIVALTWHVQCNGATPLVQYNAFHGLGEIHPTCPPADATNLFVDPLMCDPHWAGQVEDFALDSDSPCIGAGIDGTTIGALGIACGAQLSVDEGSASSATPLRLDVTPNPVTRGSIIRLSGDISAPLQIQAWDSTGRLFAERRIESLGEPRVRLEELLFRETRPQGVYFIAVQGADGRKAATKVLVVR